MISETLFSGKIQNLTVDQVKACFNGVPQTEVEGDMPIMDALIAIKAASSKREAREFVKGGSVLVNGEKVTDIDFVVSKENAFGNEVTVIRRGKKNYFVIKHQ